MHIYVFLTKIVWHSFDFSLCIYLLYLPMCSGKGATNCTIHCIQKMFIQNVSTTKQSAALSCAAAVCVTCIYTYVMHECLCVCVPLAAAQMATTDITMLGP